MISKKVAEAISKQITNEMFSAYLYMSMSAHCQITGLQGFSKWFMVQYHEEMVHAMKMYEYLQRQNFKIILNAINQPDSSWKSPLEMFKKTYEHEQFITGCINNLMDLAVAEKDYASQSFLKFYVDEQVEEEENDTTIIAQLELIKDNVEGLLMLDKDLATRVVGVPTNFSLGVEAQMKAAGGAAA